MKHKNLSGVFVAAVTPLTPDFAPNHEAFPFLLAHFAEQGSHGALILGTTGEGTSFSPAERDAIWQTAVKVRTTHPDYVLMAGTGTPSLQETIDITQAAFAAGFDATVTLPPYFLRNVSDAGLFDWYAAVIEASVPNDKALLGYHIPQVSGVGLSIDLLSQLRKAYPNRFVGIKDSTGDFEHLQLVRTSLDAEFIILPGNDKLLAKGLEIGANGCITAMANLHARLARNVWDAFHAKGDYQTAQETLTAARKIFDQYPPAPAQCKALLRTLHSLPQWPVRPPLKPLSNDDVIRASKAMHKLLDPAFG